LTLQIKDNLISGRSAQGDKSKASTATVAIAGALANANEPLTIDV
jgi:hypothetical protein